MFLLQIDSTKQINLEPNFLSDIADVAQVIIAVANIALAFYLFKYQRKKDNENNFATALINEQNIKLQWFKELIIQPNLSHINRFYEQLHTLSSKFGSVPFSEEKILELNKFVKSEASQIRKTFIDIIISVDKDLHSKIKENIDDLVTQLTTAISDNKLIPTNLKTVERLIIRPIDYSKNSLIALIYNFKVV